MATVDRVTAPHVVVLFGATGDLARRKLLPGLQRLTQSGLLTHARIVGTSLEDLTTEEFIETARTACSEFGKAALDDEAWARFASLITYVPQSRGPQELAEAVHKAEADLGVDGEVRRLHYLSVPPKSALDVVHQLDEAGLVERSRIIMEKPFGMDLETAVALNSEVHQVFAEEQIFRIDHFLGKEAAQNILAFRFANGLFEPIWNRNFIEHVQIDVPESLGLDGRTAFYESTGAYRDMVVTHLMQVLAFMAMEPPTSLAPGPISDEKLKVFRSMKPIEPHDVVRGQYTGYRAREGGQGVLRHRHVRGPQDRDRQLALGRRAVLPAHRQEAGRGRADHLDRVQGAAAVDVPAGLERRHAGPRPPHLRPRRPVADVAVVLRQAARAGHAAGEAVHAVRHPRDLDAPATCWRPTSG